MKIVYRYLTCLIFLLLALNAQAQLVVSEISYNPPEAGTDTLEYIEIYNASGTIFNLTGYKITDAVEYDFSGTMDVGAYLVIAKSSTAMRSIFGIDAIDWKEGSLNNAGEVLTIVNADGVVIDSVNFDDIGMWPREADGTDGAGASIELCDLTSDNNLGSSWKASKKSAGILINDRVLYGSPGTINQCEVQPVAIVNADFDFKFTPADITINVGETVRFHNKGGHHNVNGSIVTYPNNPDSFGFPEPSHENWDYDFTFKKTGLYKYVCDPHVSFNMVGTVTVKTLDFTSSNREIPLYHQLVVYPNPTTGRVVLEGERLYTNVLVYSSKGALVQVINPSQSWNKEIDLTEYPTGVYFIKAIAENKAYLTKVVKE